MPQTPTLIRGAVSFQRFLNIAFLPLFGLWSIEQTVAAPPLLPIYSIIGSVSATASDSYGAIGETKPALGDLGEQVKASIRGSTDHMAFEAVAVSAAYGMIDSKGNLSPTVLAGASVRAYSLDSSMPGLSGAWCRAQGHMELTYYIRLATKTPKGEQIAARGPLPVKFHYKAIVEPGGIARLYVRYLGRVDTLIAESLVNIEPSTGVRTFSSPDTPKRIIPNSVLQVTMTVDMSLADVTITPSPEPEKSGIVVLDPTLEFDQATFDGQNGENSVPLNEHFEFEFSPGFVPSRRLKITSIERKADGLLLVFDTFPDLRYRVETASDLKNPVWTAAGESFVSPDVSHSTFIPAGSGSNQFFRVVMVGLP